MINKPKYSIVICAYNEETRIYNCLKSLYLQIKNDKNVEVLIINNESSDNTLNQVKKFTNKYKPINFNLKTIKHVGLSESRNFGIDNTSGEFIIYTDADLLFDKNWFVNITRGFDIADVNIVSGRVEHLNNESKTATFLFYAHFNNLVLNKKSRVLFDNESCVIGANMAFRRIVFKKYRFNEKILGRGDDNTVVKLIKSDGKSKEYYENEAIVYNEHTDSIFTWIVQNKLGGKINAILDKSIKPLNFYRLLYYLIHLIILTISIVYPLLILNLILFAVRYLMKYKFLSKSFRGTLKEFTFPIALLIFPLHFIGTLIYDFFYLIEFFFKKAKL